MKRITNMLEVLAVLVLLVHSVIGASKNGSFINPPQSSDYKLVYYVGEELYIQWTTSIRNPINLHIWKNDASEYKAILENAQGFMSHGWTVYPEENITDTDAYFFVITDADNHDNWFSSIEFNITASNTSTTPAPSSTAQECNSTSTAS